MDLNSDAHAGGAPRPELTRQTVQRLLAFHKGIDRELGMAFFDAPCLLILLELILAEFDNRRLSIKAATIAAAVPQSTALRWIDRLVAQGLILRHSNPADRRSAHLSIAPHARQVMATYIVATLQPNLS